MDNNQDILVLLDKLNKIGWALSREKDLSKLLEQILHTTIEITNADGGTLYQVKDDKCHFEVIFNKSLKTSLGGSTGKAVNIKPIHLYMKDGNPNHKAVVAYTALNGKTVNIEDAYDVKGFDFSTTRAFDKSARYLTKSMLSVPMKLYDGTVIGVIQLFNATDNKSKKIIPFSVQIEHLVESLASQASIVLSNRQLTVQLEVLFESLIQMINNAIDEKSPYTANHCKRVPILTMMIAEAAIDVNYGPLKEFKMTEADLYELKIAGLLHDCGKMSTPAHIMDKQTKLETIFDRIQLVETRFEIIKRDLEISMLKGSISADEYQLKCNEITNYKNFIREVNKGGEFLDNSKITKIKEIGKITWKNSDGQISPLLSEDEIENLSIKKGTLNKKDREIINRHIDVTINMLESLPWPKHLMHVTEYAGGHHEKMDGTGYPKKLKRDQLSIPARMMGLADIFEALTAKDRPYKPGKTLSESLFILGKMKLDNHIDPDLFEVFIKEKVYLTYAEKFLDKEQIDEVDITKIPGL